MIWPPFDAEHLLVTANQMTVIEEELFRSGMPVPALMEKVGQAMFCWINHRKDLIQKGVVVLVGPGHNGGDGLVVARELYLAGIPVQIWCPFPIKKTLTEKHLKYCLWLGIKELETPPEIDSESLWIDGIFGLAQTRPLPSFLEEIFISREFLKPGRLISLDIPTGLCSDTGRILSKGAAVASTTLTVGLIKRGLVQDCALRHVGRVERIDIGLNKNLFSDLPLSQPRLIFSSDLGTISWPRLLPNAMKYERGRTLVIAGSSKFPGAALLAIKGAIASGVGTVRALVPRTVGSGLWQLIPEVVLEDAVFCENNSELDLGKSLSKIDLERLDSILIGPGLGDLPDNSFFDIWGHQLAPFKGLLVLDADALNQISAVPGGLQWLKDRNGPSWITPHIAEFRRLFPMIQTADLIDAAFQAAQSCGIGVLLKGAHSCVADHSGKIWQLSETSPFAARCGLGDLLAGYATGLGGIGVTSLDKYKIETLALAMFLHSEAGKRSKQGSSASKIAKSLEELTISIQSMNCANKNLNLL